MPTVINSWNRCHIFQPFIKNSSWIWDALAISPNGSNRNRFRTFFCLYMVSFKQKQTTDALFQLKWHEHGTSFTVSSCPKHKCKIQLHSIKVINFCRQKSTVYIIQWSPPLKRCDNAFVQCSQDNIKWAQNKKSNNKILYNNHRLHMMYLCSQNLCKFHPKKLGNGMKTLTA